ncbi:MAG: hypothetical protein ACFHX7_11430 [Pseudomonadota bacterium]
MDRIEKGVDNIQSKLEKVAAKTNAIEAAQDGLQPMLERVKDITGKIDASTFEDLTSDLDAAQDLLAFINVQTEGAGNSSDYVNVAELITAMTQLSALLSKGDAYSPGVNFGVLADLMAILPEKALAPIGKSLAAGGLDAALLSEMNALIPQLEQFNQINTADADEQEEEDDGGLVGQTKCEAFNEDRRKLKVLAGGLGAVGVAMVTGGSIAAGLAKTVQTDKEIQIHGYVGTRIKTDIQGAIGQVVAGIGRGVVATSGVVYGKLRHCELLYHARNQDEQLTAIIANQETIKQNQENILRESCAVTRYRSPACQALL